ncbi:hypothetical protein QUB68_24670 [Microcoleus sp. A006_D1]
MSFRLHLLAGGILVPGDREQLSDRCFSMNFPISFIFRVPDNEHWDN